MKLLIVALAILATGCATQNEIALQNCCKNSNSISHAYTMATPAGYQSMSTSRSTGAYQVMTPAGGYLVVPNASTGRPMAIIQTSKGR